METARYTLTRRLLHWLIAVMVLALLGVGMIFSFLGFDGTKDTFGGVALDLGGCADFGDGLLPGIGVVDTGHEGEGALVGCVQLACQPGMAVDMD